MKSTLKQCAMTLLVASAFTASAGAAIIPISVSLNIPGAVGSGTATIDQTALTLTAFNFTEAITVGPNSGVYTFTLPDVIAAITPGSGFGLLVFQITSVPKAGSPNTLGPYALVLAYSAGPGTGTNLGATIISGPISVAEIPEASTVSLSLLGLAGTSLLAYRRRFGQS